MSAVSQGFLTLQVGGAAIFDVVDVSAWSSGDSAAFSFSDFKNLAGQLSFLVTGGGAFSACSPSSTISGAGAFTGQATLIGPTITVLNCTKICPPPSTSDSSR
jgi:hypothetical protein